MFIKIFIAPLPSATGAPDFDNGSNADTNTGSGGGGGSRSAGGTEATGGNGSSGIIIIRNTTPSATFSAGVTVNGTGPTTAGQSVNGVSIGATGDYSYSITIASSDTITF